MRGLTTLVIPSLVYAKYQQPLYSQYNFDPLQHLSGIAPYFEPLDPASDPTPPQGCTVTRAAYLVRHAAINANDFDYETYLEPFTDKLKNSTVDWSKIPEMSFLSTWFPPSLSEQELVTRTGRLEAAQLGVSLSYRYANLRLPKRVWASSANRTLVSAQGFIRGIEMGENEIELVNVYEGEEAGANTLTPYKSCERYSSSYGSDQSMPYVKQYTSPIIDRLRSYAPGFNWTSNDVVAMFEWCGYDTVVRGSSPFCSLDLFRPDEWLQFEYAQDLMYFHNTGYGNEYSGAIGYPWLNATAALLASNSSDQDVFVSFTHRELPPTVLVAMGLFNNSQFSGSNNVNATMPQDQINFQRQWVSSRILPFLTNIAVEKMNCSQSFGFKNVSDPTFYRVLVNQSPQTLPGCHDGPLQSCSAAGFKKFLADRAAVVGDFGSVCQNTYDNSTDVMSIYTTQVDGTKVGRR